MKEQVSVDCKCVCHQLPQKGCSYCSCRYGCINPKTEVAIGNEIYHLATTGLNVQVSQNEYERLKRLDDNVKRMISELKNKADKIKNADCGFKNAEGEHVPSKEWVDIKHFIMRLRSLYNEKAG